MSTTERLTPEQIAEHLAWQKWFMKRDGQKVLFSQESFATYMAIAIRADRANGAKSVLDSAAFADLFTVAVTGCRTEYVSVHRNDRSDMCADELGHIAHGIYDDMMQDVFA